MLVKNIAVTTQKAFWGKEDKIGTEVFRWARAKVFNYNKTSVGRVIDFGCATR